MSLLVVFVRVLAVHTRALRFFFHLKPLFPLHSPYSARPTDIRL